MNIFMYNRTSHNRYAFATSQLITTTARTFTEAGL